MLVRVIRILLFSSMLMGFLCSPNLTHPSATSGPLLVFIEHLKKEWLSTSNALTPGLCFQSTFQATLGASLFPGSPSICLLFVVCSLLLSWSKNECPRQSAANALVVRQRPLASPHLF